MKISSTELISPEAAAEVAKTVRAHSDRYTRRGLGFYTLGRAVYLDVAQKDTPASSYYDTLQDNNTFLEEHYGWFHKALLKMLETRFPFRFILEPTLALPGFHVFEGAGLSTDPDGPPHFDQQWRYINKTEDRVPDALLSATLVLRLPSTGGGLQTWQVTEADLLAERDRSGDLDMTQWMKAHQPDSHPYTPGFVYIQENPGLHRIAPTAHPADGDQRITLQAHAIVRDDRALVYW